MQARRATRCTPGFLFRGRPHRAIRFNARGAHNVSTAEWTLSAILAMLKQFPFRVELLRVARTQRENPKVHSVAELNALIPLADVIVLILPYTKGSHWLIDGEQIALMRQGALLVNAARGPIVNTDALIEALHSHCIRAALDVSDPEPLPEGHPLWSCPNLLITLHIGASSPQFAANALRVAANELRRYVNGEPLENAVQAAI